MKKKLNSDLWILKRDHCERAAKKVLSISRRLSHEGPARVLMIEVMQPFKSLRVLSKKCPALRKV